MDKMEVCRIGKLSKDVQKEVKKYYENKWTEEEIHDFSQRLVAFAFQRYDEDLIKTIRGVNEFVTK